MHSAHSSDFFFTLGLSKLGGIDSKLFEANEEIRWELSMIVYDFKSQQIFKVSLLFTFSKPAVSYTLLKSSDFFTF